jgi:hypothetical protein
MTSPDAITWTLRPDAPEKLWTGVTYADGLFVAVATVGTVGDNARAMTSRDGINWTLNTTTTDLWWAVTHANGKFVAVGQGSTQRVMTAPWP